MIVIVRDIPEDTLRNKLGRRGVVADVLTHDVHTSNGEWRMTVREDFRAQVRAWFAEDDDVLWFSRPEAETA